MKTKRSHSMLEAPSRESMERGRGDSCTIQVIPIDGETNDYYNPTNNYCNPNVWEGYVTEEEVQKIKSLEKRIDQLEKTLKELKEVSEITQGQIKVIKVREIEFEKAKHEINDFIHDSGEEIDSLAIAEKLSIDPLVVLKAINELIEEDEIEKC